MTDQKSLVNEWNKRWDSRQAEWSRGVPVSYCPNPEADEEDRDQLVTTTYGMPYVDKDGYAVIRLNDYGRRPSGARLDRLTVLEDVVAKIKTLGKVDGDEAIQRYPECPDCYVEMNWDEGFDCPVCHTHFDDNCQFSHKFCVEYECFESADLLGEDGQPRCTPCTTLVLAGEQDPFGPYSCSRCNEKVVGIPARSVAGRRGFCRSCQAADDRQRFLDDILGRRS